MEPVAKQTHKLLLKKGKTIAVAESCTGGLLSEMLTRYSGSAKFFLLGVVSYSNKSKQSILKVPNRILLSKGAVSKEVAVLLSKSVRKLAKSDFGIGITGIAGPTGGSAAKPVGTVFIAADSAKRNICKKLLFKGNRQQIRRQSAVAAMNLLKDTFLK